MIQQSRNRCAAETKVRRPSKGSRALTRTFFDREADEVARSLIGVLLLVGDVGGRIVETESYDATDPASHSFRGPTKANAAMFGPPGHAYVYRSYGLHWCLNFVCKPGSAVLLRALEPKHGIAQMISRRGTERLDRLCAGPGRLCSALDVSGTLNGASLFEAPFQLMTASDQTRLATGPRIGITKAADLRRRFGAAGSPFLSRPFG